MGVLPNRALTTPLFQVVGVGVDEDGANRVLCRLPISRIGRVCPGVPAAGCVRAGAVPNGLVAGCSVALVGLAGERQARRG